MSLKIADNCEATMKILGREFGNDGILRGTYTATLWPSAERYFFSSIVCRFSLGERKPANKE
jgi:hypothetical protein